MPEINFNQIISVSSEEKNFPAESLLRAGEFKKWKCKLGEAKAVVIIKLEKSSYISKIDVGNEGSAFIEVLVGRSALGEQDFNVILVASSFMSPSESKLSQNLNRVRMFGDEDLNKSVANQKWDVIKIICTQPFNKNTSYGISFIKLYSPSAEAESIAQSSIGNFQMKSTLDDKIEIGSFFKKRNLPPTLTKNTIVANIKATSFVPTTSTNGMNQLENSKKKLEDKQSEATFSEINRTSNNVKNEDSINKKNLSSQAIIKKKADLAENNSEPNPRAKYEIVPKKSDNMPPSKKSKLDTNGEERISGTSLSEVMSGVVLTISGLMNPKRGQVKSQAIEMGAKYKADWDDTCTHLICAFENTPKFRQINGKGVIVKIEWIEACYKEKKLLPWRDFRLGRAKSPPAKPDINSKIIVQPIASSTSNSKPTKYTDTVQDEKASISSTDLDDGVNSKCNLTTEDIYDRDTDSEDSQIPGSLNAVKATNAIGETLVCTNDVDDEMSESNVNDSDSETRNDTEEEVQQFIANEKLKQLNKENKVLNKNNNEELTVIQKLPEFFTGKAFLLYGDFSIEERKILKRYIVAYNGKLCEYMDEKVNYVVTNATWDNNFDMALKDNGNLIFVRPTWLSECSQSQKLTPFQKHIVPAT